VLAAFGAIAGLALALPAMRFLERPVPGSSPEHIGFGEAWDDLVQRKTVMGFLSLIEREPSAHGASDHLVAVAHAL